MSDFRAVCLHFENGDNPPIAPLYRQCPPRTPLSIIRRHAARQSIAVIPGMMANAVNSPFWGDSASQCDTHVAPPTNHGCCHKRRQQPDRTPARPSKRAEHVALREKPLYGAGERVKQLVLAFERVVESDDGTGTGIMAYVPKNTLCINSATVVTCNKIPHDKLVVTA